MNPARLQSVDGFGEEVIVQGQFLPAVIELEIGKGHVADDGVDAVFGQRRVAEALDADVVFRMQRLGDPPRDGIHFDADKARPFRRIAHEIAGAASRFQYRCAGGNAEPRDGLVDAGDDGRGCVEGVEGGSLGAVVLCGSKQ